MRKILLALMVVALFTSCEIRNSRSKADVQAAASDGTFKDSTTVQIIDSIFNFGKITEGDKVEYNFKFRNTGKNALVITNAVASCGCTVPEKPDAPIPPGQVGVLKVVFNSKGKMGDIHKEVTVTSNAYPAFSPLVLKGEVKAKE